MPQYRYSDYISVTNSVKTCTDVDAALQSYLDVVFHAKKPRSFLRCLDSRCTDHLEAHWRPSLALPTFTTLQELVITDAECMALSRDSSTRSREPTVDGHARPWSLKFLANAKTYTDDLRTQYKRDVFNACAATAKEYKDATMTALVRDHLAAEAENAIAKVKADLQAYLANPEADTTAIKGLIPYEPLNSLDGHPITKLADFRTDSEDPSLWDDEDIVGSGEPVQTGDEPRDWPNMTDYPNLRAFLAAEAEATATVITFVLLPSTEKGKRFHEMKSAWKNTPLYGSRASHALAIKKLQKHVAAYNPIVVAPRYSRLSDTMVLDFIRHVSLQNFSEDARVVYEDEIEDDDEDYNDCTAELALERLKTLPSDHDEQIVVPWRTFAAKSAPIRQQQRPSNANNSNSHNSHSNNAKPPPRRLRDGGDQFRQFKDKKAFDIPANFDKYCDVHGFNSTHTTQHCRVKAEGGGKPAQTQVVQKAPQTAPQHRPARVQPSSTSQSAPAETQSTDRTVGKKQLRPSWKLKPTSRLQEIDAQAAEESDEGVVEQEEVDAGTSNTAFLVRGAVNDTPTEILIDSGAAVSCISQSAMKTLGLTPITDTSDFTFANANDETFSGLGVAVATLKLPSPRGGVTAEVRLQIIPRKRDRVLIGCDVLRQLGYLNENGLYVPLKGDIANDDALVGLPQNQYLEGLEPAPSSEYFSDPVTVADGPIGDEIRSLLRQYDHLFSPTLPPEGSTIPPMRIPLINEEDVVYQRPRPLARNKQLWLEEHVRDLTVQGLVRPSAGPFASPVVLPAKGDAYRLCVDYVQLNRNTTKDRYPLPNMRELLRTATQCSRFGTMDLTSGYWQVLMHPDDIKKTAFCAPGVYHEFTRMPFGLSNAPSHFQRGMEATLGPLIHNGANPYLDDIFMYAHSDDEFLTCLEATLKRVDAANMRLKPEKCHLGDTEATIVGFRVTKDGIYVDPERVKALKSLSPPANVHELRMALGKFQFLASFVDHKRHELFKPLTALLTKNAEFNFTPGSPALSAFTALKDQFTEDGFIAHPDETLPWTLETDASNVGAGGVLSQDRNGKREILAYFSHTFTPIQSRWSTPEQELFAIVFCLTHPSMTHMLRMKHITLRTDHKNLIYMIYRSSENAKVMRWRLALADFSFDVEHIAGSANIVADVLSRLGHDTTVDEVEVDTLLHNVTRKDGVITVPVTEETADLRARLIATAHRGHHGETATRKRLLDDGYTWSKVGDDIHRHVSRCPICLKARLAHFAESSLGTTAVYKPFHTVAMDTIGPIPADNYGCKYIFVMVDLFSRYTELYPSDEITAEAAATALWSQVICRHGAPAVVKSDNGPEYTGKVIKCLLEQTAILEQHTLPYRPQSNGTVERRNGEVMKHLRCLVLQTYDYNRWSQLIPAVQLLLNTATCSATGCTPHEMLYGTHLDPSATKTRLLSRPDVHNDTALDTAAAYISSLSDHLALIAGEAAERQRRVVDARIAAGKANDTVINVGDFVLAHLTKTTKLHGHIGPFKVIQAKANKTFIIEHLIDGSQRPIHHDQLLPFDVDAPYDELKRLAASDEEAFEVDDIIGHRRVKSPRMLELQVKWTGYDVPSWQDARTLIHLPVARTYLRRHKLRLGGAGCRAPATPGL